jgi:predicted PurR-regulated permease PerM
MVQGKGILFYGSLFVIGIYVLFVSLTKVKPFLAPLAVAIVLAMLMLPIASKMERWGMKRLLSSLLCTFFLFLLSLGFTALIGWQIHSFVQDWDKAKQKIMPQIERLEQYVYNETPISKKDVKKQKEASTGDMGKQAMSLANGLYSFSGDYLLTIIYVFFLLNYRRKFRMFFENLFPADKKDEVDKVLYESVKITAGYLYGKFLLMLFLAVLYAIGMGISGVSNFIVISLLAALLTIIPYIGNIIGFAIALGLGYVAEGDTNALIGIIATFTIVQFVETYFFEPYVVGDKVNLDPLMTILSVVAGSLLWGVTGMILSVPVLGIVNVVFGHVKALQPYHYLLSNESSKKG